MARPVIHGWQLTTWCWSWSDSSFAHQGEQLCSRRAVRHMPRAPILYVIDAFPRSGRHSWLTAPAQSPRLPPPPTEVAPPRRCRQRAAPDSALPHPPLLLEDVVTTASISPRSSATARNFA